VFREDDPRKGQIALVITRNKTKLRLLADCKGWNTRPRRRIRKKSHIPHSLSGSASDSDHQSPAPQKAKHAKRAVRPSPSAPSDNDADSDVVPASPPHRHVVPSSRPQQRNTQPPSQRADSTVPRAQHPVFHEQGNHRSVVRHDVTGGEHGRLRRQLSDDDTTGHRLKRQRIPSNTSNSGNLTARNDPDVVRRPRPQPQQVRALGPLPGHPAQNTTLQASRGVARPMRRATPMYSGGDMWAPTQHGGVMPLPPQYLHSHANQNAVAGPSRYSVPSQVYRQEGDEYWMSAEPEEMFGDYPWYEDEQRDTY
jgi:hypothetical protein